MLESATRALYFVAALAKEWTILSTEGKRQHVATMRGVGVLLVACLTCVLLWGFTVDDALISCRFAARLAAGAGHTFNEGPPVDGVTPLGWSHLLAVFGLTQPLAVFSWARALGIGALLTQVALLSRVSRSGVGARGWSPLLVAASPAACAYASSGMETPLVGLLVTLSAVLMRREAQRGSGALVLEMLPVGLAAAWRPELVPAAMTLALLWPAPHRASAARVGAVLFVVGTVMIVRLGLYGSPLPLSWTAKAPNIGRGVQYGASVFLFMLMPALLSPGSFRFSPRARAYGAAALVHVGAVVLAGGDWMPLGRLVIPVLPLVSLFVLECDVSRVSSVRLGVALAMAWVPGATVFSSARAVWPDRQRLIASLPELAPTDRVAAVDIGWLGATHEGAIVDLGGVVDASVAALGGGHTSRPIPSQFLDRRSVSHVLVLHDGQRGDPSRQIDRRLLQVMGTDFIPVWTSAVERLPYVLYARASASLPTDSIHGLSP